MCACAGYGGRYGGGMGGMMGPGMGMGPNGEVMSPWQRTLETFTRLSGELITDSCPTQQQYDSTHCLQKPEMSDFDDCG